MDAERAKEGVPTGASSGNAASGYAFFILISIYQLLNSIVEAMEGNQGIIGSQYGDLTEAAANPHLPSRDGAPDIYSCLGDGDNTGSDFQHYPRVLDRSRSPVRDRGGTTQGSAGSGGGAVGPPGLAPCQTSGGTPDRTSGQRGSGTGGFSTSWRWHDPKVSDGSRNDMHGRRINQSFKRKKGTGVGERDQGERGEDIPADVNDAAPDNTRHKRRRHTGEITRVAKRAIQRRNTRDKKRYYWRKRVIGRSRAKLKILQHLIGKRREKRNKWGRKLIKGGEWNVRKFGGEKGYIDPAMKMDCILAMGESRGWDFIILSDLKFQQTVFESTNQISKNGR